MKVPQSQEEVIARLLQCFAELPTQLQITARYIIDHPYEVGVETMRSLASAADVHPNSFVRLARHIGFGGYDEMRERFREFVRSGAGSLQGRALWLQTMAREGGAASIVGEMTSSILNNMEQMIRAQDMETLERAVSWMMTAKRVFVLGVGGAYPLANNFCYLARMASDHFVLLPQRGSLPMDDLMYIGETDLLFAMTFQPYRTDVIETFRFAKKQKAKTIGLSDSPAATICREADLGLHAPTHTPQFFHSNAAVVALLETLCSLLVAKGDGDVVGHIEDIVNIRWESGMYED